MDRVQRQKIEKDLSKKLVVLVGPRQVGKTWLAQSIASEVDRSVYLNYDQIQDRNIIMNQAWLDNTSLLVLDELHKMPEWKNYLKGLYDTRAENLKILVTGSARMQAYSQVGDSLAGRYFKHRLLPYSLAELNQIGETGELDRLLERGGFPEPYLSDNELDAKRWRVQYLESMLSTDVLDFEEIKHRSRIKLLVDCLRNRVGSPISYQSLAEDLSVSANTIKRYIEILEALFIVFRVTPYSKNIARSLQKATKVYFYDNGMVLGDVGSKLENLVAVSLQKECLAKVDYLAENVELNYLRTREHKEVDFALVNNGEITELIEVKASDRKMSTSLKYFCEKYNLPGIQLVKNIQSPYQDKGIKVLSVKEYLQERYL